RRKQLGNVRRFIQRVPVQHSVRLDHRRFVVRGLVADVFWESATKRTDRGGTLEMRIPFSSLRYKTGDPQTWGILRYRNCPRDFHYQFFSARMPRGGNCFVCRSNVLVGLERLPSGGHLVAASYVS